jgi:hypothetical protein
VATSAAENKPMLVLFSKTYCGACKRLKESWAGATEDAIAELSADFVMVHLNDDDDAQAPAHVSPQGHGYIPRAFFLEAGGDTVRHELINEKISDKYKYFYPSADALMQRMKSALPELSASSSKDEL